GVVQERARRGAGGTARRPGQRRSGRARRRHGAHARRAAGPRTDGGCGRGGSLDRGAVPPRGARAVPRAGPAVPAARVTAARAPAFDMDGVLIDSGAYHRDAWDLLLRELGHEPSPEGWRLTIGRPAEEAVSLLLGRRLDDFEARTLARRKRAHYTR